MLPSVGESRTAYKSWVSRTRKLSAGVVHPALSNEQTGRQRWRGDTDPLFSQWAPEQAITWTLYVRCIPAKAKGALVDMLAEADLFRAIPKLELVGALKELGELCKVHQSAVSPYWEYAVDVHILKDYEPSLPVEEFEADIRGWVTGDVEHTLGGSEEEFLRLFEEGVWAFLSAGPGQGYRHMRPTEWLADPGNWARSGTSDAKRLRVVVDGDTLYARKSKWASGLALTPLQLEQLFWEKTKQKNKAIQKRELGKVRAIIAGDLGLYLNQSYVGRYILSRLDGHPNSTLFMSGKQQLELWEEMARQSEDTGTVKMPLDQSGFDRQVNVRMLGVVNKCFRRLVDQCMDPIARTDLRTVLELAIWKMKGGTVRVGNRTLPYEKGVLSGWAWTALYDTIINAGELYAMRARSKAATGSDDVLSWNVQGDDDRIEARNYRACVALWAAYTEAGFDINPRKFFIKRDCDEYLRQVGYRGATKGYPARACPSLVWRNPVTRELARGEERIREAAASWNQFFNRCGRASWGVALADMAASNKMSFAKMKSIVESPSSVGGCGLGPWPAVTWAGVSKARPALRWSYAKLPPAAVALGASWPVTAQEVADLWRPNVEVKGGVRFEDFAVRTVAPEVPIQCLDLQLARSLAPMAAEFDETIPPSVVSAIRARRDLSRTDILRLLTLRSRVWEELFWTRASRTVYWDWVRGDVSFKTPVVAGYSSLAAAGISKRLGGCAWDWYTGRSHMTRQTFRRLNLLVEEATPRLARRELPVIGG